MDGYIGYSDFNNSLHLKITWHYSIHSISKDQGTYEPRHKDSNADIVMLIVKNKKRCIVNFR